MVWKNGGGETWEIARDRDSESYDWRLSVATVRQSGPFSQFPGYDRVIVQIDGAPMRLVHRDSSKVLEPMSPYQFSGDIATEGILAGSAARDFNVIFRRGLVTARVAAMQIGHERPLPVPPRGLTAIHVIRGIVFLKEADSATELHPGDTFLTDHSINPGIPCLAKAQDRCDALIVQLSRLSSTHGEPWRR